MDPLRSHLAKILKQKAVLGDNSPFVQQFIARSGFTMPKNGFTMPSGGFSLPKGGFSLEGMRKIEKGKDFVTTQKRENNEDIAKQHARAVPDRNRARQEAEEDAAPPAAAPAAAAAAVAPGKVLPIVNSTALTSPGQLGRFSFGMPRELFPATPAPAAAPAAPAAAASAESKGGEAEREGKQRVRFADEGPEGKSVLDMLTARPHRKSSQERLHFLIHVGDDVWQNLGDNQVEIADTLRYDSKYKFQSGGGPFKPYETRLLTGGHEVRAIPKAAFTEYNRQHIALRNTGVHNFMPQVSPPSRSLSAISDDLKRARTEPVGRARSRMIEGLTTAELEQRLEEMDALVRQTKANMRRADEAIRNSPAMRRRRRKKAATGK